ncbi:PREDICTED: CD44 antigen isoform X3 [Ficedula albicollis]|uniref:CD44 antigen isoform X3 n=1 Tax=Ficedula albicollis TaxID=59894 RepID=UPI000359E940|nr:PREDICTED: CD44 antigen isoform X3 [Ficedula albicollis]
MATFSLWAAFGLCLLKLCLTETEFNVSCRYGGVFHVEKNGRYSLTRSEAVELCRALNSTLATLEQLKKAHELGFETCRYGFVVGHIVIPRINPYHLCAANNTGIYKLSANTTARYDAYCYNETETADKTCEPVVKIDTSLLSNQDETVIDNADGSRYNADGTRHTGGESSTSGGDEENAGSGSTHETTAMDASIRRSSPSYYGSPTPVSQLPDHTSGGGEKGMPGKDYDDEFPSVSPDISLGTVAGDFHEDDGQYPASPTAGPDHDKLEKTTTQAWWNPFQDHWWWSNPGEKTQEPTPTTKDVTSSGSDSDDEDSSEEMMNPTVFPGWGRSVAKDETALSPTADSQHETLLGITTQDHWSPTFTDEEEQYPSSASRALVASENEKHQGPTQHPQLHSIHSGGISQEQNAANTTGSTEQHEFATAGENYFGKEASTATVPSHGAKENDSAHEPWLYPGWDEGEDYATQPAVTERVIPSRDSSHERQPSTTAVASPDGAHHEEPTQSGIMPWDNGPEMSTEGIVDPTDAPEDEVLHGTTATMIKAGSSVYGDQGPHKGHYESTTIPGETATTKIASQPRSAPVPDWLIIVVALVVLALILAVCIAVNARRRCGQKQKLVINNGKGAVEDRKTSELNGDISKSQEMVHLVHKEQSNDRTEACDEFLTVNETQNHHEFDMKTGV